MRKGTITYRIWPPICLNLWKKNSRHTQASDDNTFKIDATKFNLWLKRIHGK